MSDADRAREVLTSMIDKDPVRTLPPPAPRASRQASRPCGRRRMSDQARMRIWAVVRLFLVMVWFGLVLMVSFPASSDASRVLIIGECAIIASFFVGRSLGERDG